jgi:selenocysteine-specific elongation factor
LPADHPLTLGTAGHIDHGKTALVAALTGVDTDRLPQEKARGISIELGYAPLVLPSGRRLSVVDVPGHERFVRTMVAGATGIDLFLLVVACDDGVMPQTREHVAVLRLLGLDRGVVALTKRDLVDDETAALVRLEVEDLLGGTEAIEVSSRTGEGLDALREALDSLAADLAPRTAEGPVRLPIDRVFTLRGIGTVVTGTLWSGTIVANQRLAIQPGGIEARVRSVQVHDQEVERAGAGQRVAVALVGPERRQLRRGQVLASPGSLRPSYRLETELAVLPDAPHPLRNGERVTVHHGTAEAHARLALRGAEQLAPGAEGPVQLRLRSQVAALAGDRLIVRLTAPSVTVAGGVVLDPAPPRTPRSEAEAPEPAAAGAAPAGPPEGADELLQRLSESPLTPPALTPSDEAAAAYLAREGRIVRAARDLAFTSEGFAEAQAAVVELASANGTVTIATLRDRLGISRRYAQAILEALDATGITRRIGDERILRRRGRDLAAEQPGQ